MSEITFFDSESRFTDPVRLYKENDPFYYFVDNIHINELNENDKWLKSQIEGLLGASGTLTLEVNRSGFSELKPYVNEYDNIVRVKPGRYTSRINDAYSITPLQRVQQVLGFNLGEINQWQLDTLNSTLIGPAIQKLKSTLAADALNMNGLVERAFTYPVMSTRLGSTTLNNTIPIGSDTDDIRKPLYPNAIGFLNFRDFTLSSFNVAQYDWVSPAHGFEGLGYVEAAFTQRWRGIARTSIVDIPNELTIEIPAFDPEDHTYTNEDGTVVNIPATQRVDLVFIYSKPVDASSTTIAKYVGGVPTTITQPTLGIVKGAGIGVNFAAINNGAKPFLESINAVDSNGVAKIIGSVADENATNIGFNGVKGSFPSPDDLMNISPLLAETLETTNYALIGQSILPVAYVVVRSNAVINETWGNVLQLTDVIDIRPFFRTTELSYNERAGIAAAVPQLSLANPVATEGYVDVTAKTIVTDYISRIAGIPVNTNTGGNQGTGGGTIQVLPRVVAQGYIRGGYNYGVEGSIAKFLNDTQNLSDKQRQIQEIIARYNLVTNSVIPDFPDWDTATWVSLYPNVVNPGLYPNDRLNFILNDPTLNPTNFASYSTTALNARLTSLNIPQEELVFVSKTIALDKTQVQWMGDYEVNVKFWNCTPLDGNGTFPVIISKKATSFTIFVVMPGGRSTINNNNLQTLRENAYGGVLVLEAGVGLDAGMHPSLQAGPGWSGPWLYTRYGICTYPTISFEVVGIPANYSGQSVSLNGNIPTLSLA